MLISDWSSDVCSSDLNGTSQNGLLEVIANDYWSENDRDVLAFWPRLSSTVSQNNSQTSNWWMRNGSFLRLKTVELGYTLPEKSRSEDRIVGTECVGTCRSRRPQTQ